MAVLAPDQSGLSWITILRKRENGRKDNARRALELRRLLKRRSCAARSRVEAARESFERPA